MGAMLVPWWYVLLGVGIGLVYGGFGVGMMGRARDRRVAAHVAEADELVDDLAVLLRCTLKAMDEDDDGICRRRKIRDWRDSTKVEV